MSLKVYKIWSIYCSTCTETAVFDKKVLSSLGLELEYVSMENQLELNSPLSKKILEVYPSGDFPVPLYIQPFSEEEDVCYLEGGMSETLFRIYAKDVFQGVVDEESLKLEEFLASQG